MPRSARPRARSGRSAPPAASRGGSARRPASRAARAEDVVEPPAPAVAPRPARLARRVAVQRAERVGVAEVAQAGHDAELRLVPEARALLPQPALARRGRTTRPCRRAARAAACSSRRRRPPARRARREPRAQRGERLRLDQAVGRVGDVHDVDLDPARSRAASADSGHGTPSGAARLERRARRQQHAVAPRRRRARRAGSAPSSEQRTCGSPSVAQAASHSGRVRAVTSCSASTSGSRAPTAAACATSDRARRATFQVISRTTRARGPRRAPAAGPGRKWLPSTTSTSSAARARSRPGSCETACAPSPRGKSSFTGTLDPGAARSGPRRSPAARGAGRRGTAPPTPRRAPAPAARRRRPPPRAASTSRAERRPQRAPVAQHRRAEHGRGDRQLVGEPPGVAQRGRARRPGMEDRDGHQPLDPLGRAARRAGARPAAPVVAEVARARSSPSASSSASMSSASRSFAKSPSAGWPLQPKPRRSGAITRKRAASGGITPRHAHQCCGQPWTSRSGGADASPASATCSRTPVGRSSVAMADARDVRSVCGHAGHGPREWPVARAPRSATLPRGMGASGRRRGLRWLVRIALAAFALVLILVMVTAARGEYDVSPYPVAVASAPKWTMPCFRSMPRYNHEPQCARVRGRVVGARRDDPDGDGDRHIVVLSRMRFRVVKLKRGRGRDAGGSARRSRPSASRRSAPAASARSSPRPSGADARQPAGQARGFDSPGHRHDSDRTGSRCRERIRSFTKLPIRSGFVIRTWSLVPPR